MKIVLCVVMLLASAVIPVFISAEAQAKSVTFTSGKQQLAGVYYPPTDRLGPAVLLLHGCGQVDRGAGQGADRLTRMAALLQEMGFGVLMLNIDSPGGRRLGCASQQHSAKRNAGLRANDAQMALAWLKARSDVDAERVAVMGWSQGASTVLALMNRNQPGVKSAIAFYPDCRLFLSSASYRVAAPTLILVGEEDQRSTAAACRKLGKKSGQDLFHLVSYPDAKHDFDELHIPNAPNAVSRRSGSRASLSRVASKASAISSSYAAQDAWRRSFKWLSRWFDPERGLQGVPAISMP